MLIVIDTREAEAARQREIARRRTLIGQRRHNVELIGRYLSMFRYCLSPERKVELLRHLAEVAGSIPEMTADLCRLEASPLY